MQVLFENPQNIPEMRFSIRKKKTETVNIVKLFFHTDQLKWILTLAALTTCMTCNTLSLPWQFNSFFPFSLFLSLPLCPLRALCDINL